MDVLYWISMNPLFHPYLVNGPEGDPTLYIDIKFARRAVLFDLGEIGALSPRKILRLSHIFISHTHMDHFIGFDRLLRLCLGREKLLRLFGPPHFIDQLENRLSAYTWNLIENFPSSLDLLTIEVHPGFLRKALFRSSRAFKRERLGEEPFFQETLHEEDSFRVKAAFLDHKIPCLGFSLEERFHINILEPELVKLGFPKGPWLRDLKEALWRGEKDAFPIPIPEAGQGGRRERTIPLGELRKKVVRITPGQKISYVVDTQLNPTTHPVIKNLIQGSDRLFIEAAFLEEDASKAEEKHHLTARQAGRLGREGGVKELIPCHFSPKYSRDLKRIYQEAMAAFQSDS